MNNLHFTDNLFMKYDKNYLKNSRNISTCSDLCSLTMVRFCRPNWYSAIVQSLFDQLVYNFRPEAEQAVVKLAKSG